MTVVIVLAIIIVSFVVGVVGGVIVSMSLAMTREDRPLKRRGLDRVSFGTVSLFDLTGATVYALLRHSLAVRDPDRSAIGSFRASARIVADSYEGAVRDSQRMGAQSGNL